MFFQFLYFQTKCKLFFNLKRIKIIKKSTRNNNQVFYFQSNKNNLLNQEMIQLVSLQHILFLLFFIYQLIFFFIILFYLLPGEVALILNNVCFSFLFLGSILSPLNITIPVFRFIQNFGF